MRDTSWMDETFAVSEILPSVVCLFSLMFFLCGIPTFSQAGMELPTVLKISPDDHAAVVETADGEKRLVKEGSMLLDYKIAEISEGRMVLEGAGANGPEKVVLSVTDDGQSAMRITKTAPSSEGSGVMISGGQGER